MKPRVLLVEDDAVIRFAYAFALAAEGFEVLEAEDGLAGLELLNALRPQVVILDIMMPHLDGMQFMRIADNKYPLTKIIVVSNVGSPEDAREALRLGAYKCLLKSSLNVKDVVREVQAANP